MLGFYGQSIFTTEGDEWLGHRTVARKAFGEKNHEFMWTETVASLQEWFDDWDAASNPTVNFTDTMLIWHSPSLLVLVSAFTSESDPLKAAPRGPLTLINLIPDSKCRSPNRFLSRSTR